MEEVNINNCNSNGSSNDSLGGSENICRDFLRNVCTRGSRCKFKHPNCEESWMVNQHISSRPAGLIFCHDFQNTHCTRPSCKFVHGTRQDEEHYKVTGELPKPVHPLTLNKGNLLDSTTETDIPICKDYLKGECQRGKKCKFRHIESSRSETKSRHERPENYDTPETKRRHFGVVEFCSHNHSPHQFECGSPFRENSTVNQCHYNMMTNSSPPSHPSLLKGSRQVELSIFYEENWLLRRKVEELKKQVSDLMATNEFLLDQNAHMRIQGKLPTVSTVATVTIPTVTIANSVTVPVTSSVTALGSLGHPVQTVQAMTTTVPLMTSQSTSNLRASIPYPPSLATVSIAPVAINQTGTMVAQAPALSTATVTLTPTLSGTALQLAPNTALSLSGTDGSSLVSYPIMTQSLSMTTGTLQTSI